MNTCGYCGRENGDEAVNCIGCGTSLTSEEKLRRGTKPISEFWITNCRFWTALKAGGGVVFVLTAIIVTIGRLTIDAAEAEHGGRIGKPGIYAVGIMSLFYILPAVAFTVPLLGLACVVRCKSLLVGITSTCLSLLALLFVALPFRMLLPAVLLGRMAGSSIGYYVGAIIHLGVGAWLLGSFDRWLKSPPPANNPQKRGRRCQVIL